MSLTAMMRLMIENVRDDERPGRHQLASG